MRFFILSLGILFYLSTSFAKTERIPQFSNEKVTVWETIVYPGGEQKLVAHRHDHDRVLIALDDGVLKITNNRNETHLFEFSKNKAYFLEKDLPNETHTDINITDRPVKFMVIELKNPPL